MRRTLKASKVLSLVMMMVFALLAMFFFYGLSDEHWWVFALPAILCAGCAVFWAYPIFAPKIEFSIDDEAISVAGRTIQLDRIECFYSDPGCIIILSKGAIGSLMLRNDVRIWGKELFLAKFLLGEMKDVLEALNERKIRQKSFLWRRLPYWLAP